MAGSDSDIEDSQVKKEETVGIEEVSEIKNLENVEESNEESIREEKDLVDDEIDEGGLSEKEGEEEEENEEEDEEVDEGKDEETEEDDFGAEDSSQEDITQNTNNSSNKFRSVKQDTVFIFTLIFFRKIPRELIGLVEVRRIIDMIKRILGNTLQSLLNFPISN